MAHTSFVVEESKTRPRYSKKRHLLPFQTFTRVVIWYWRKYWYVRQHLFLPENKYVEDNPPPAFCKVTKCLLFNQFFRPTVPSSAFFALWLDCRGFFCALCALRCIDLPDLGSLPPTSIIRNLTIANIFFSTEFRLLTCFPHNCFQFQTRWYSSDKEEIFWLKSNKITWEGNITHRWTQSRCLFALKPNSINWELIETVTTGSIALFNMIAVNFAHVK